MRRVATPERRNMPAHQSSLRDENRTPPPCRGLKSTATSSTSLREESRNRFCFVLDRDGPSLFTSCP